MMWYEYIMISPDDTTRQDLSDALEKLKRTDKKKTIKNFSECTNYNQGHIYHHYNSWNDFLLENDLQPNRRRIDDNEMINELKKLGEELGGTPTAKEMDEMGDYASSLYEKHFNSWNSAIQKAGFELNKCDDFSKEDVVEHMEKIDPKPKCEDLDKVPFSIQTVRKFFSSWNDLLLELGYKPRKHEDFVCSGEDHWKYKENWDNEYGDSWNQQRLKALKRDSFQCRVCSSNERTHVHHIKPVRKWNVKENHEVMNDLSNLICLCQTCHNKLEGNWQESSPAEFERKAECL